MSSTNEPSVPPHQDIEPLPPLTPDLEPLPAGSIDEKHTKVKAPMPQDEAKKFTRAGALWTALAGGFLVLVLMLIFIMQNTDPTTVRLFVWEWELPVGVALLLGAIAGGLLTFLVGTVRILQLRHAAKKNLKAGL